MIWYEGNGRLALKESFKAALPVQVQDRGEIRITGYQDKYSVDKKTNERTDEF